MIQINDEGVLRRIKQIHVNDEGTLREIDKSDFHDSGLLRRVFDKSLPVYWHELSTTPTYAPTFLGGEDVDVIQVHTNQAVVFSWDDTTLNDIYFDERIGSTDIVFAFVDPGPGQGSGSETFTLYINDFPVTIELGIIDESEEEEEGV